MKLKPYSQIQSIWIWIVSTLYSFIYISLLWFDYFSRTSIHTSPFLFYPFVILGLISLLLSYPILRIDNKSHFDQDEEKDFVTIRKSMKKLLRVNFSLVILNLFAFASWVTFIVGPGV